MLQQKRMCDMMSCKPVFFLSFGFPDANPANSADEFICFMHFPRPRSMLIATEENLKDCSRKSFRWYVRIKGTQRLFTVKYLFGEANMA